jgi:hypothetical protein
MIHHFRRASLTAFVMLSLNCAAQSADCLSDYKVKLTLLPQAGSFDLSDFYWPASDSSGLSQSDTFFTLAIENMGCKNIGIPQVPGITYEDERPDYGGEIFFRLWFQNKDGIYVRFNSKSADIDFIEDPAGTSVENTIAPGQKLQFSQRMNPFFIHGERGPGRYRLQAFYRYATPCGDYVTKSNFTYIKIGK